MKKVKIKVKHLEARRLAVKEALPEVRTLVKKFDLSVIKKAVNDINDERKAEVELKEAQDKVANLKSKLRK